jgi:hypothetical protein
VQTFQGGTYRARHETLLAEAANDRRSAEARHSPDEDRSWLRWTLVISLLRSVASHLRHQHVRAPGRAAELANAPITHVKAGRAHL